MLLAPGTRFAHTKTWTIDCNDYGDKYYEIYHVVRSTPKTVLLLNATLFSGNVHVDGNKLMDKVVQASQTNAVIINQVTTPQRYKLKTDSSGNIYFNAGIARHSVSLNGDINPVTYLIPNTETHTDNAASKMIGQKRARAA